MNTGMTLDQKIYQIQVSGWLDERWSDWFDGMIITPRTDANGAAVTYLTGPMVDQVALRGVLSRLWDLNLNLVSIIQVKG